LNLPNLITVGRFFFIPLFLFFFFSHYSHANLLSFLVLSFAGLGDILDGYLARKRGEITEIGKLLDPLADKLLLITVIIAFVIDQRISWLAAGIVLLRDVGMIIISAFFHFKEKRVVPAANFFGKATTVFYYCAFILIMFQLPYATEVLWLSIILSILTSGIYFVTFFNINKKIQ
jgi:cardiolipin synthase